MGDLHHIAVGATETGPRPEQQDAFGCFSSNNGCCSLVVVCDGVGGKSGGQAASHAAVEAARMLWAASGGDWKDPEVSLRQLCADAHEAINRLAEQPKYAPRSTIAALYVAHQVAHWVNIGDSRVYHFRSGQMVKRTRDHSVLQVLIDQGEVTEAEAGTHPDQGRLLRALGGEESFRPSYDQTRIDGQDTFLLCTDGFWERTGIEEVARLLAEPPGAISVALQAAVRTAVTRNGPKGDNVTAAVVVPEKGVSGSRVPRLLKTALNILGITALVVLWGLFFLPIWRKANGSTRIASPPKAQAVSPVVAKSSPRQAVSVSLAGAAKTAVRAVSTATLSPAALTSPVATPTPSPSVSPSSAPEPSGPLGKEGSDGGSVHNNKANPASTETPWTQ